MLFTWNCWSSALLLFHFLAKFLRNHSYCILLPPLPLQGQSLPDQGKQWICTASSLDIMKYSFVDLSCQLTQMSLLRDLGCFLECALAFNNNRVQNAAQCKCSLSLYVLYFSNGIFLNSVTSPVKTGFIWPKEASNVTSASEQVTLTLSAGTEALPRYQSSHSKTDEMSHGLKYFSLSIHCSRCLAQPAQR